MKKFASIACLMFLLTACVNLQPSRGPTINTYTLSNNGHSSESWNPGSSKKPVLLVSSMRSMPGTETAQMTYVQKPYALMHFAQNRWIAPPAEMLTPIIVQSLQNTGRYRAVVSSSFTGNIDFRLDTELLTLQQEFFRSPSQVRLVIQSRLMNAKTADIISTKRIEVVRTSTADDPYHGVLATHAAVNEAMRQLAKWARPPASE